ncbi:MAG: serine hydrolase domain-containing protein [Bacteroidota bacterium]
MKKIYLVFLLLTAFACTEDKPTPQFDFTLIDSYLAEFEGNRPGYALGIIQNGQLVYSKGYGVANLDYNIPITDTTVFYIGSMAKQFTVAALLILESEGKVDLNKPVQFYLQDFPEYNQAITLNHLVHHISGIRETNSMQLFQGIDQKFEEVFDTEDLYQLIKSQKTLNFPPGQEYRYSSGGYAVLAKIIEQLSGTSFRTFLGERIFTPLNMSNTMVSDNHNEIIPNRAVSYWPIADHQYERRSLVFDAYGDGGIVTTIKDLANWDKAFYEDLLGVPNFADKMYQTTTLNNGQAIDYARALNVWNYKGQKVVQHNGGMLGFRVDIVRFPALETSIILLGNAAFLNPTGDALNIAELILPNKFKEPEKIATHKFPSIKVSPAKLAQYSGYYWTDQTNYFRRISTQNDSLFLDNGDWNNRQYLQAIAPGVFVAMGTAPEMKLSFELPHAELEMELGSTKRQFRKFDASPPTTIEEVKQYIGTYHSKELSSIYQIFQDQEALFLKINEAKAQQIFPLSADSRMVWNGKEMLWIGFGEIKFIVEKNQSIQGFEIGDGRVSGIKFEKIS